MENEEAKFTEYERIRQTGKINMFDIPAVMRLSDNSLSREEVLFIMTNYHALAQKYLKQPK